MKAILVIDMPHCCHDCILADWDQCLCKAKNKEIYSQEYMDGGRQKWCPLRPLQKGHGAIKDVSQIEIPMCEDRTYEKWVQVAINSAPTIIEADKGETE